MRFSSFIDKKNARAREELEIIRDILKDGGLKVEDFLKSESPYIFLSSPQNGLLWYREFFEWLDTDLHPKQ